MAYLKRAARRVLPRRFWDGLRRLKRRSRALEAPKVMHHLRRMQRHGFHPAVIVDVGAARGDWTKSALAIFPWARVVMLEPLNVYRAELSALAKDERVRYVVAAAGPERTELPLLVPREPGGASFLPSNLEGDPYFRRSVTVPVVPLDAISIPGGIVLLKLDVQGYELEVLAGAGALLKRVEVIVAECSLQPFQRGIPLVHDVVAYVREAGFRVFDIGDELRWRSGALAQVDLLFVREESSLNDPRWWS